MKSTSSIPNAFLTSLFCLLCILFCFKGELMLADTDYWWHIASGDAYKVGENPYSDIFSFTTADYPWLSVAWLWDLIYSWLNKISPLYLPVVVTAIINAITLSILAGFILKRSGAVVTILVIMLSLVPYSYMLTPRPHEITFLFTVLFYITCHRVAENKNVSQIGFLPLLMVAWVNIHGGFFIGLTIIGAYFLQALVARNKHICLTFFIAGITCLAATLVNPLGLSFFDVINRTAYLPALEIISEWQPMHWEPKFYIAFIYIGLFLISFRLDNKTSIGEKLLSIFWLVSALRCERNLPIFIVLSAPVLAMNLKSWAQKLSPRFQTWLTNKDASYTQDFSNPRGRKICLIIALILTASLLAGLARPLLHLTVPADKPQAEAEFIKAYYPNHRFLNDYFQGGYILYVCRGAPAIFADGRGTHAYPQELMADYLKFHYQQPGWQSILDKYKITGVILPKSNPSLPYFAANSEWKRVFEGNLDTVYVRHK